MKFTYIYGAHCGTACKINLSPWPVCPSYPSLLITYSRWKRWVAPCSGDGDIRNTSSIFISKWKVSHRFQRLSICRVSDSLQFSRCSAFFGCSEALKTFNDFGAVCYGTRTADFDAKLGDPQSAELSMQAFKASTHVKLRIQSCCQDRLFSTLA